MIYHVTPITPERVLLSLAGRAFMVRWGEHRQAAQCERIGCAIAYDNGAYGFFRKGIEMRSWQPYYDWLEPRLFHPGRWAIIPDVIAAGSQLQDALVAEWPFGHKGAPVWHTDEPIDRLLSLVDRFPRVCIGSTGDQWQIWLPGAWGKVLNPLWRERMDKVWDELGRRRHLPAIHMLRGTALMGMYPFDSADSSSVAQNHHRHGKKPMSLFPDLCGVTDYADKLERRA